jgi:hypothetical protein
MKQVFEVSLISANRRQAASGKEEVRSMVNFMLTAMSAVVSGEW